MRYFFRHFLIIGFLCAFSSAFAQYPSAVDDSDDDEVPPEMIESWIENQDAKVIEDKEKPSHKSGWFLGGGGGFAVTTPATTLNTINNGSDVPAPGDVDQYDANDNPIGALIDLEGGYRITESRKWFPEYYFGLRYRYFIDAEVSGDVIQLSNNTLFNNYNFTVTASPQVLTLFGKIAITRWDNFSPYISAGAGVVADVVNSYSESSTGATGRESPDFGSQTNFGMAYEAGLGVDYFIKKAWVMSAEYDYLYLGGDVATGNGTQEWSSDSLDFGALSANTFLLKITYFFNA